MKIKRFDDQLNEMHQNDHDQLIMMSSIIQKYIPDFNITINGYYGEIKMKGMVKFHTTGPYTDNIILAYVSGLMVGLINK